MTAPQSKPVIGIFYGGQSAEHEVSVRSARNIFNALDLGLYEPVLIAISKTGVWHLSSEQELLENDVVSSVNEQSQLALIPGQGGKLYSPGNTSPIATIDLAFPALHGPYGEDGAIQGLFETAHLPYVGPGILGSAVGMDKDIMKRLLRDANIAITPYIALTYDQRSAISAASILKQLGPVVFVKPANMGSSVGVSRADSTDSLTTAIALAFKYDSKILVEAAVDGIEIECSVLGNEDPQASKLGRIAPKSDVFYSYDAKYINDDGADLEIPAALPADVAAAAQQTALQAYRALNAEGLSRIDMFVTKDNAILVNEINTLPGFTKISMYPKLWEASGLTYTNLITKLIQLAQARYERRASLQS